MNTTLGVFSFGKFVSASRRAIAPRVFASLCGLVIALATIIPANAQTAPTGSVTGRVQNVDSGTYLNNARIRVIGTTRETFTDQSGGYRLVGLPAGEVRLDVFYTGLATRQVSVMVPAGGTATLDVDLMADEANRVVRMSEFVVQSQREMDAAAIAINEQRFAAARKDVVSTDAFGEINQGNIGEFIKFLPGISLDVKDGNTPSGIMVRGFDPNYTNVTMDGGQLASTLIANTQTSSRQFVLEGMNINNVARIEVAKLPTPDMSANLLGGAVNFISKSAFERSRPEFRASVSFSANEKAMELGKTPGPFIEDTFKVLPSFDFQYVNPVSRKFGYVITAQHSSQFYLQNRAVQGYRYNTGGSVTNPYITNVNTNFAPNRSDRTGGGITVDAKPWEHNTFRLNVQASAQKQQTASRGINYNVGGTQPVSWDQHNTFGAASGGSVSIGTSFQERHALTRSISGGWEFDNGEWNAQTGFSYSNANNRTRDMTKGFFRSISVNLPNVRTVNLLNVDTTTGKMGGVQVLGANGVPIDELKLSNWNLTQASNASEPANNVDDVKQLRGNVTRHLKLWGQSVSLKIGGDITDNKRDTEYATIAYTYLGPDGIQNSGDEGLANYVSETDAGISPGFGRPAPQWPDSFKIFREFLAHPNWWTQTPGQQGDSIRNAAVRSPWFHETITSGFAMADARLFSGRMRVVGGVRYELTEDEGQGRKENLDATFVRDAQGNIVYTTAANGSRAGVVRPELLPTNGPAYQSVYNTKRGYYAARDYHYYHPSAALTYSILENLQFRAAFAKTIGRPNLSDIVPNLYVAENLNFGVEGQSSSSVPGFINGANTGLKPWTAKNYDYSLEYYFPKGGMVMFNVYRKDIRNFFSTITEIADEALLARLGLGPDALGYQYTHRINVSDARIQGWEAALDFPLSNFAEMGSLVAPIGQSWLRHFAVRFNMTHLDLSGSRITSADWRRYIPRSRNASVHWRFPKFSGSVLVNWRGRMLRDTANNAFTGANEYIRARYQVDASAEYQLTKRYSVFVAGRNLLNAVSEWEVTGPGAPGWSAITNIEDYGAQYTLGVRAVF